MKFAVNTCDWEKSLLLTLNIISMHAMTTWTTQFYEYTIHIQADIIFLRAIKFDIFKWTSRTCFILFRSLYLISSFQVFARHFDFICSKKYATEHFAWKNKLQVLFIDLFKIWVSQIYNMFRLILVESISYPTSISGWITLKCSFTFWTFEVRFESGFDVLTKNDMKVIIS